MTPALERCLDAYRAEIEARGRTPTMGEMVARMKIRGASVERLLQRLRLEAYEVPLSKVVWAREFDRERNPKIEEVKPPGQQAEALEIIDLIRLADRLMCRYAHPEDKDWDGFRTRAARYLNK